MALEKRNEYKIEILEDGTIQVRVADVISEDGVDIATNYRRHLLNPGDDVSNETAEVQSIAAIVHTQPRIDAYQASLLALDAE